MFSTIAIMFFHSLTEKDVSEHPPISITKIKKLFGFALIVFLYVRISPFK